MYLFCRYSVVQNTPMAMFLGLPLRFLHFISRCSLSSHSLSSVVLFAILLLSSMHTPPPSDFLFLAVYLLPLMFKLSVPFSLVSDIGAMSILSLPSRDYRIFSFPLIPYTLIAAMFRVLFFLILFLLALLRGLTGLFSGFIIFISGFRLGFLFVLPLCSLQFQLGFYFFCHFFLLPPLPGGVHFKCISVAFYCECVDEVCFCDYCF